MTTDDPMLTGDKAAQEVYQKQVIERIRQFIEQDRAQRSNPVQADQPAPVILGSVGYGDGPRAIS